LPPTFPEKAVSGAVGRSVFLMVRGIGIGAEIAVTGRSHATTGTVKPLTDLPLTVRRPRRITDGFGRRYRPFQAGIAPSRHPVGLVHPLSLLLAFSRNASPEGTETRSARGGPEKMDKQEIGEEDGDNKPFDWGMAGIAPEKEKAG
jgi:hypothetical protein